jgi:hypothetical protein
MIRRAFAIRYDRRAGAGRNDPLRVTVETADGEEHEVFLKVSGAPELSVAGMAAEVIAACLAGKVGLPICEPLLVEISSEWIGAVPDVHAREILDCSNPVTFGSTSAGDGWKPWSADDRLPTGRRQTALEILAYDAFIENPDRKPSNPNLLVRGDDFRLIDHELSLRTVGIFPRPEPWRTGYLNLLAQPDGHIFYGRIKASEVDLRAVRAAWVAVSDDWLADIEACLPMEWNEAADFVSAAMAHVRAVRDRIDDCLTEIGRLLG